MHRPILVALPLPLLLAASIACVSPPQPAPAPPPASVPEEIVQIEPSPEILRRADADRVRVLEAEVSRLRADLRSAEETLLAVESGMRGAQGRAEAVSGLAETRIQVERAVRLAPWRVDEAAEARAKLAEAERQLAAEHIGSTIFFVSRARRIADSLAAEAERVRSNRNATFVRGDRVNLREAPSKESTVLSTLPARLPVFVEGAQGDWSLVRTATGQVGFVHTTLLNLR
ncbi:SH3 domain-containing protein [Myxococcota bacterium]|nr:SH3 domain-containing protein [Myxococcota bacterium]